MRLLNKIIKALQCAIEVLLYAIKNVLKMIYRIDIKSDEIAKILGVNANTARRYIRLMKAVYNKTKFQVITIAEFCSYFDTPYKTVFCQINNMKHTDYDKLVADGYIEEPPNLIVQNN